ncbi:MAG: hypothetical protein KGL40_03155 [Rhodocyclaceae bacterium]|nr:hypothetical protein [Rhodocyclaceae bacterium]
MKPLLIASALAVGLLSSLSAPAQAQVGVSVSIGEPGFFGRIDLGDAPPPQFIYRQPIAVEYVDPYRPPIYLRVPPGYEAHWRDHCREYGACGERVYFVRDDWYRGSYMPYYARRYGRHDEGRHEGWRDDRHDDRHWDDRHDDHRGNDDRDHGHGRGHDRD